EESVIHMQIRADQVPEGNIQLEIGCGEDCRLSTNINTASSGWKADEWQNISIPFSCLQSSGIFNNNIQRISFVSELPSTLSIHNINIEKQEKTVTKEPETPAVCAAG